MGGPRIPAETRPRIPFSEGGPVYTSQDARSGGEPSSRWYSHATPQPRPSEGYGLQLGHGKKTPWRDEQRTGSDPAQRSGRQMPSQQSESRYRLADEDSAPVPRRTRLTKPPIKLVSVGGVPVDANAPSQNPTTAEAGSHEAANIASLTPKPLRINKEATPTTPTKARRASMDGDLVGAKQSPHKRDYSLASLATQFEQLSVASPKKDPLQGLAAYALLKTTPTKQATLPNWGLLESTEAMKKEEEAKSAPVAAAKNTTVAASMAKSKWAPTGAPVGMVQETLSPVAHYNSQALLHRPAEAAVMEAPRPESYSTSIPDVGTHATASREEKLATKPLNVEHDQPYDAGESVSPEYPRPTSSTASQAGSVLAEGPEEDDTIPHPAVGKPSLFNPEAARLAKKDFEGMTKAQPGTKKRSRRGGRSASVPRGGSSSYAGPPFHGDFAPRGGSPARGGSLIRGGSLTHGSPSTRSSPSIRGNLAARGRSTTRPSSTTHGGLVSPSGGEPLRCFYQDREGGCPRASGECPFVHDRPHEEPEDKLAQEPSGDQSVGSRSVEHQSRSQLIDAQNNKVQTATTAQVKSVHAAQPVDIQDDSALVGGALSHGAHTGGAEHVVIPSVGIETITAADWDDIESVGVRSVGTESVGDHSDVSYPSDANSVITQHGSVMSSGAPSIGAASTGTPSVGAPATAVPPVGAPLVVTSYMSAPSTAAPSVGSPVVGAHSVGTPSVGAHSVDAPFVAAPSLAAPSFVASFISAPSAAPQSVAAQSASDLSTGGQSAGSQYGGTNQSRKKFGNGKAPCAFYTTPGGCPRGMYCHFFHDPAYDADRKTTATEGMLIGPHLYPGRDRM